jgi:hypothetical protein
MKRFWLVWCAVCLGGCLKIILTIHPQLPTNLLSKAQPSPSPSAKAIAVKPSPSLYKGAVLGTATNEEKASPTPKPSPTLYGTNTPVITVTNYKGEPKNVPITLINKSSQPVMWYIKLKASQSDTYPININNTNETTGSIAANSTTTVNLGTKHATTGPVFKETFDVVFRNNLQILETAPITITINSEATKYITARSDKDTAETIQFIPNGSYGMLVENKQSEDVTWTAAIKNPALPLSLGFSEGTTAQYVSTYVPVVFTNDKRGTLSNAEIIITYKNAQSQEIGKHTVYITITD